MSQPVESSPNAPKDHPPEVACQTLHTTCCIVGGGPAGAMLALFLVRAGIRVILLEAHKDFERDFRGDTIHPSTLEVLDQIGLATRLHELPHVKAPAFCIATPKTVYTMADFTRLRTPFPYIMLMPQSRFLQFVTDEAREYPHFTLLMGAAVQRLIEQDGHIVGVSFLSSEGTVDVRATLTVAADGRFSRVRKLAGLEPDSQSPTMEVLWCRLPRRLDDHHDEATLNAGYGHAVVVLARVEEWQVGYVTSKGGYQQLRREGLKTLQQSIAAAAPWLADRVSLLNDWEHITVLSVEANRLARWHRPGLLLIGDAAHVMLPVGGVGINCAISDAVEAANVLTDPLRADRVQDIHLAEVQRRRERATRIIQKFQTNIERRIVGQRRGSARPFTPPLALRIILRVPGLRNLPARLVAFGVRKVRLERPQELPAQGY